MNYIPKYQFSSYRVKSKTRKLFFVFNICTMGTYRYCLRQTRDVGVVQHIYGRIINNIIIIFVALKMRFPLSLVPSTHIVYVPLVFFRDLDRIIHRCVLFLFHLKIPSLSNFTTNNSYLVKCITYFDDIKPYTQIILYLLYPPTFDANLISIFKIHLYFNLFIPVMKNAF